MCSISIQSFLSILLASSILLGQMNSIPEYSKDVKNHNNYRITIGSEAFSAKNSTVLGAEDFNLNRMSDKMDSEKSSKKAILLWSFGTNLSSFINEEGTWQLGYSVGLTFDFRVFKNLSITLPFSYTRINAAPENVEGRTFPNIGENIYKTLNDWQVSVGFLEFPILFTYKFFSKNSYDIRYILGPGLVIATKDFSKIENITKTDEIIGVEKYGPPLEPQHELYSGYNIITGIRFHVSRFYISVLYALYPYKIKSINKLNSISFRLGIDIH